MTKSISIVSTGNLKSVHGANYVLDYLIKSKPYFKNVFIKKVYSSVETLNVVGGDDMPIGVGVGTSSYKAKRKIRSFLRELLSSKFLPWALLKEYLNFIRPANKVAKKVMADKDKSDWLIFQDFTAAYYYLKNNPKREEKTAMIVHQENDSLSQYFHTFPAFSSETQRKRILGRRDYVYSHIDKIIYISIKACEGSIADKSKRVMIYNGIADVPIDKQSKFRNDGKINLVCVGSMSGWKGQELIIQALAKISKDSLKKVHLCFVGDGAERANLETLVTDNKLGDVVEFMGIRKDVADILTRMDVFVMPSISEGLSISSLEALRGGLFLMMTDTGGNCEVMGEDCGKVVTRDPQDIADKLEMIIKNNLISKEQKERSVARFHQYFSLERMAEGYEKMVMSE